MNSGSYRDPRSSDGRMVNRPGAAPAAPVQRHVEEQPAPAPIAEPKPVHHRAAASAPAKHYAQKPEKSPKRFLIPLISFFVIGAIVVFGLFVFTSGKNDAVAIDSGRYQAVFFTNGQVYFGKLQSANNSYLKLTDVYYLQTEAADTDSSSQSLQGAAKDQSNVQLIKLGDEIHGPEDEMVISKDQVLFYENLKDDSRVVQSIAQHKKVN